MTVMRTQTVKYVSPDGAYEGILTFEDQGWAVRQISFNQTEYKFSPHSYHIFVVYEKEVPTVEEALQKGRAEEAEADV